MRAKLKRMHHNLQPTPIRPAISRIFRGCKRKKAYETEAAAERAIRSIKRNGNDTDPTKLLNSYKCQHCSAWHVGHSSWKGIHHPLHSSGLAVHAA